ncbi:MAG: hypothetical protein ND895_03455 [Pyrinomonadaceae bacterium]|nr:hypothetical protein [Pyrinomonadaceae bacterium]
MKSKKACILFFLGCYLVAGMADTTAAKTWRGIVPLRSKRADVRRVLGKPIIGTEGAIELYEKQEGRVQVMYARKPCEQGLPADWGNWKVSPDTVVNISITLHEEIPVANLKIRNIEKYKWYTGDSGATYYRDERRGVEYQVQDGMVTAIAYGPTTRDRALRCRKDAPLIRY